MNHSYVKVLKWNVSSFSVCPSVCLSDCLSVSYYHGTAMQKIRVGQPKHNIFEAAWSSFILRHSHQRRGALNHTLCTNG